VGALGVKLQIGPLDYRVRPDHEHEDRIDGNQGLCEFITQTLWIDADLPPDAQAATLLHEVVHAAGHAHGFSFPMDEEAVADFVGNAIGGVLRRNPHLLRALVAAWTRGVPIVPPEPE
jgi:hypothetical protein